MSLTSFVVWKSWASNPLRTALTVLGIAVGVAIVVAIYVMDHNTIQSRFLALERDAGPVDLTVTSRKPRALAEAVADLRARPGVAGVAVWREGRADAIAGKVTAPLAVFGLDGGLFAHYAVGSGRDLTPGDGDGAVLLGGEAARLLQAAPGMKLQLREPAFGTRYECRNGTLVELPTPTRPLFATEVTIAGILTADRIGRRNQGLVMVCSRSLAAQLAPVGRELLQLRRVYGADFDRLQQELQEDYQVEDVLAAQIGEGADERAFRNGLKVLGCLALLLGMFVVFQTLSHSLVARVRQLGLLRCLGASRGAVARIFLGDALLLGIMGSLLGLALGVGFAAVLRSYRISSLGGGHDWLTFELPLLPMAWTAALGIVFTLAGAAFPLWRARQLPALWILRQRGIGDRAGDGDLLRGVNVWLFVLLVLVLPLAYLAMTPLVAEEGRETRVVLLELAGMIGCVGGLLLLAPMALAVLGRVLLLPCMLWAPLSAWLCRKTIERQSGRIASGVVGLATVMLAFLGLKSITAALQGDVERFTTAALVGRSFVSMGACTAADVAAWSTVPGVAAVEPILGEVQGTYMLRGVDVAVVSGADGALAGDPDAVREYVDPRRRSLIASRRLASKKNWRKGDLVPMVDKNGVPVSYRVLAISDASGYVPADDAWAVVSPHWLRTDWCMGDKCVQHVTLRLQRDGDAFLIGQRIKRPDAAWHFSTGSDIANYLRADVDRDFYIFDLLLLLTLLLAATGLLNGMTISALGRAREIGVLQALGVGRRSLRGAWLFEGLLVGLLASLLALGLCVPMASVLVEGLNRVAGLTAPTVLPIRWMVALPFVAMVTGVLAALLPASRAARMDPAEAVRCE